MALIAHWPLNGNTNDISGNGYILTNNGATYVSGKIGQAADFVSASSQYMVGPVNQNIYASNSYFTLSFWVYLKSFPSLNSGLVSFNKYYTETEGGGFGVSIKTSGILTFIVGDKTNTNETDYAASNFPLNIWHHLSMKFDGSKIYHYLNGQLLGSINRTSWRANNIALQLALGTQGGWQNYSNIRLNDVRLYNHSLADIEIQELARAKILHYTFDDMQEPSTNLVNPTLSTWGLDPSGYTTLGTRTIISDYYCRIIDIDSNTRQSKVFSGISASKTYTASIKFKKIQGAPTLRFQIQQLDSGGINLGSLFPITTQIGIQDIEGWQTAYYTFITVANTVSLRWYIQDGNDYTGYTHIFELKEIQIEEKPYVTEFIVGSRTGRVNDYSGFFNHSDALIEVNTPRWIPEAKVGTGAYQFNGSQRFSVGNHGYDTFTVAAWIYPTASGWGGIFGPELIGFLHFQQYNTTINYYIYGTSGSFGNATNGTLTLNAWQHVAITYNGSNAKVYINGSQVTSTAGSVVGILKNNQYYVGFSYDSGRYFDGNIDDFRLYGEALSDKDILDLYNTKAEIEQSGVLYARDFLSNVEPVLNILSTVGSTRGEFTGNHGTSTTFKWDIEQKVRVGEEYVFSGEFFRNILHSGRIYAMFRLEDANGILIPGDAGLVPGWAATVAEPLYKYFHNDIRVQADGKWYQYSLPKITIPAGYENGTIRWIQFVITTSPTDASFITTIRKPQFERGDIATNYAETFRPAIELPSTLDFAGNEVHETGTANFEDFSTVGITDGLIGYWPMNQNAKDYSGNNYNGTVSGAILVSDYYSFDGIDDYITLPNGITYSNGFSVSVFAYPKTFGESYGRIVDKTNGTTSSTIGFMLYMNNGQHIAFSVNDTGLSSTPNIVPYNTWTHIVATIDNIGSGKIYINGDLNNSITLSAPSNITTTNSLTIGNRSTATDRSFDGYISDLKIFNRVLSAEEIAIEYNTMFNNEVQIHEDGVLYAKDIVQY